MLNFDTPLGTLLSLNYPTPKHELGRLVGVFKTTRSTTYGVEWLYQPGVVIHHRADELLLASAEDRASEAAAMLEKLPPIAPEEDPLLAYLPSEDSQPEWYGRREQPLYSSRGEEELTPEEEAALLPLARRFIGNWLSGDAHNFIIPGTPWGRELLWAIHQLQAATQPLLSTVIVSEPITAEDLSDPVAALARSPRLTLHTDNHAWAEALPAAFSGPDGAGAFFITVTKSTVEQAHALDHKLWVEHEDEVRNYRLRRAPGNLTGWPAEELQELLDAEVAPALCSAHTTVAGDPWHGCSLPEGHTAEKHRFTRRLYGAYPEYGIKGQDKE
jgi:hypothetical protein